MDPIQAMIAVLGTIVCAVWCAFTIDVWVDGYGTARYHRAIDGAAWRAYLAMARIRWIAIPSTISDVVLAWNHAMADVRVRALTPATIAIIGGLARLAHETRGSLWIPSLDDVRPIAVRSAGFTTQSTTSMGSMIFGLVATLINLCKVALREDHILRAEGLTRYGWAFRPDLTNVRNVSHAQIPALRQEIERWDRSNVGILLADNGDVTTTLEWSPTTDPTLARSLHLGWILRSLQQRARSTPEALRDCDRDGIYHGEVDDRGTGTLCLSGNGNGWRSVRERELSVRYWYQDRRTGRRSRKVRAGRMILRFTAGDRDTLTLAPVGMDPARFAEWRGALRESMATLAPVLRNGLPIVDLT